MPKPAPEIIPADKQVRQWLLIVTGLYVLFGIWLQPLIDYLLQIMFLNNDPMALDSINQTKQVIMAIVFGCYRAMPMLALLWLGYRILTSARIPPARMKLPFAVPLIQGRTARIYGLVLTLVALMLIYRELVIMARVTLA